MRPRLAPCQSEKCTYATTTTASLPTLPPSSTSTTWSARPSTSTRGPHDERSHVRGNYCAPCQVRSTYELLHEILDTVLHLTKDAGSCALPCAMLGRPESLRTTFLYGPLCQASLESGSLFFSPLAVYVTRSNNCLLNQSRQRTTSSLGQQSSRVAHASKPSSRSFVSSQIAPACDASVLFQSSSTMSRR